MTEPTKPDAPAVVNAARVDVAFSLLLTALRLPEGTVIREVHVPRERVGVIELVVEHPDLPLTREGDHLLRVLPRFKTEVMSLTRVSFDGWGTY